MLIIVRERSEFSEDVPNATYDVEASEKEANVPLPRDLAVDCGHELSGK